MNLFDEIEITDFICCHCQEPYEYTIYSTNDQPICEKCREYLMHMKCDVCGKNDIDYFCENCGRPLCEGCCVPFTQFNQCTDIRCGQEYDDHMCAYHIEEPMTDKEIITMQAQDIDRLQIEIDLCKKKLNRCFNLHKEQRKKYMWMEEKLKTPFTDEQLLKQMAARGLEYIKPIYNPNRYRMLEIDW